MAERRPHLCTGKTQTIGWSINRVRGDHTPQTATATNRVRQSRDWHVLEPKISNSLDIGRSSFGSVMLLEHVAEENNVFSRFTKNPMNTVSIISIYSTETSFVATRTRASHRHSQEIVRVYAIAETTISSPLEHVSFDIASTHTLLPLAFDESVFVFILLLFLVTILLLFIRSATVSLHTNATYAMWAFAYISIFGVGKIAAEKWKVCCVAFGSPKIWNPNTRTYRMHRRGKRTNADRFRSFRMNTIQLRFRHGMRSWLAWSTWSLSEKLYISFCTLIALYATIKHNGPTVTKPPARFGHLEKSQRLDSSSILFGRPLATTAVLQPHRGSISRDTRASNTDQVRRRRSYLYVRRD